MRITRSKANVQRIGANEKLQLVNLKNIQKNGITQKLRFLPKDIQVIESIQRYFTKRIAGCNELDYWDCIKKLNLMSLQRRRERFTIIHAWKILQNKSPNSTGLEFYNNDRLGARIQILPFNYKAQRSVSTAYDNSFGVKSARLWNLLPNKVNYFTELEAFKVSLGDFLVQVADKPPVPGYTQQFLTRQELWERQRSTWTTQIPTAIPAKLFKMYQNVCM